MERGRDRANADVYPAGTIVGGKYRVAHELGRGGMGVVLAATHLGLEEQVAIKVLLHEHANDQQVVARFEREAKAAAKIRGEHVGRVHDIGHTDAGVPFIVLERLQGADLSTVLEGSGPLPVGDAITYILQACEAIAQAHAAGIVHRDLKPSNLFLTRRTDGSGCVKVLDFGIAKQLSDNIAMTETSDVIGSPQYMSPEQLRASRDVDARTDIWALGVVLYELLAGVAPFQGRTPIEVGAAILHATAPPITKYRADVPPGVDAALARCLQKDPADRFPSIGELAAILQPYAPYTSTRDVMAAIRSVPPPASSLELAATVQSGHQREPRRWAFLAVIGIAPLTAFAVIAGSVWLRRAASTATTEEPTAVAEPSAVAATTAAPPSSSTPLLPTVQASAPTPTPTPTPPRVASAPSPSLSPSAPNKRRSPPSPALPSARTTTAAPTSTILRDRHAKDDE